VDCITASRVANMKELRPLRPDGPRSDPAGVRAPWRSAVLMVVGDKSWQWDTWYRTEVPRADHLYDDYVAERRKEMGT